MRSQRKHCFNTTISSVIVFINRLHYCSSEELKSYCVQLDTYSYKNSNHSQLFCKADAFEIFTKSTGIHVFLSIKIADLQPIILSKKRPWERCFPVNLASLLRSLFLQNYPEQLLKLKYFYVVHLASMLFFFFTYKHLKHEVRHEFQLARIIKTEQLSKCV